MVICCRHGIRGYDLQGGQEDTIKSPLEARTEMTVAYSVAATTSGLN